MGKDGEWDCSVNEELVTQAEAAEAQNTEGTVSTEQRPPEAPTARVTIEPAPTATAAPVTVIKSDNNRRAAQVVSAPTSAPPSQPDRPQVAARNQTGDAWECQAGTDGNWVCNDEPGQRLIPETQIATQPRPTTVAPQVVATVPFTPKATPEVIGNEWECGTSASGAWDCKRVNIHALSRPAIANRGSSTSGPAYITDNPYSHLDWVYYSNPKGQQCVGRYLEPALAAVNDAGKENPPLYMEADQSSTVLGGLTQLQGGVRIRSGQQYFNANTAEFDQVTSKARLEGDVRYREPGLLMLGESAQFDTSNSEAIFETATYVMHQEGMRGNAKNIIRLEDERIRVEDGSFTYCPPGNESWNVSANSIVLNQKEGFGVGENVTLRVGGIPVFYSPYFSFPIDDTRRSGFLYPSIAYSKDSGVDLTIPYYFNIATNIDDTLTTRLIADRGLLLENELRYLNNWSSNTLNAAYLHEDDTTNDSRWLIGLEHRGNFAKNWHTEVDYTAVSDEDYFDDLNTDLEINRQDHLDKRADIAYTYNNWQFRARVHDYQTIDRDSVSPYKRLPQLTVTGSEGFASTGEVKIKAEFTRFDRNLTGLSGADRVIGDRRFVLPSINYLWQSPWGYIKPEAALWSSSYTLDNQLSGLNSNPSINVPIVSIDSGLVFERSRSAGGTHTLEPRLLALYVPEENQDDIPDFDTSELDFSYNSLFRRNRFSGQDRIGDTQQLSLGLSSRLFSESGNEQASFSIGQAYYFKDRKVQLNSSTPEETSGQSDIATEMVWYLSPHLRTSLDMTLDNNNFENKESNLRLRYNQDLNKRFDFSYRFEDDVRKQTDLSFIWPLSSNWTALGRWLYDLRDSESLETSMGLEYESCCWKVGFAGRRWLDDTDRYDTGMFLNFTLKGLGSFGSGSSGFLNDIIGYEERKEHNEN